MHSNVPREDVEGAETPFLDLTPKCDAFAVVKRCDQHVIAIVGNCPRNTDERSGVCALRCSLLNSPKHCACSPDISRTHSQGDSAEEKHQAAKEFDNGDSVKEGEHHGGVSRLKHYMRSNT